MAKARRANPGDSISRRTIGGVWSISETAPPRLMHSALPGPEPRFLQPRAGFDFWGGQHAGPPGLGMADWGQSEIGTAVLSRQNGEPCLSTGEDARLRHSCPPGDGQQFRWFGCARPIARRDEPHHGVTEPGPSMSKIANALVRPVGRQ